MVRPRRLHEPDLADDLQPHVQGGAGVFPVRVIQLRPNFNWGFRFHYSNIVDLTIACHAVEQRRRVELTVNVIGKRTPDAIEHTVGLILGSPKIWAHPLSHTVERAAFLAVLLLPVLISDVARYFAFGLHIFHRRSGKHSFGPRHGSAIRADVDCANGLAVCRVERYDPDRIAMLVRSQSISSTV